MAEVDAVSASDTYTFSSSSSSSSYGSSSSSDPESESESSHRLWSSAGEGARSDLTPSDSESSVHVESLYRRRTSSWLRGISGPGSYSHSGINCEMSRRWGVSEDVSRGDLDRHGKLLNVHLSPLQGDGE